MLVGHFAVGFAAKRVEPRVSVGTVLLAAMLADILWTVFMFALWVMVPLLTHVWYNNIGAYWVDAMRTYRLRATRGRVCGSIRSS
jgi:hypothetical protein